MLKLFFLGTGKMATAIAGGIVRAKLFAPEEMAGYDVSAPAAQAFTAATGVAASSGSDRAAAENAEAVLLAVKPQMLAEALAPFGGCFAEKTVLSIAAGVPVARVRELCGAKRIIRIMPNTPALVGAGAAALAPAPEALAQDIALAEKIFSAVGTAVQVREGLLDAVTALSGSGPGYVFEFIQALADGGVAEGLPRDLALRLAAQTVLGSAQMVLQTGTHPAILKDQVTSPAGTTSRALEKLAAGGFDGVVMEAVRAAAERSRELGKC